MNHYSKFATHWLPVITYCLLLFIQSSYPPPGQLPKLPHLDKGLHFIAYALLAALFFRAYRTAGPPRSVGLQMVFSAVSAGLYGLSDEVHQHFVPGRYADPLDLAADVLGSVCGACTYRFLMVASGSYKRHRGGAE